MQTCKLKAKERKPGEGLLAMRKQGQIAAVVYGKGFDNLFVNVAAKEFQKIYKEVKGSVLLDLVMDKKEPFKVLIKEVQKNPLTDEYIHIDFYKVRMDKIIKYEVPLKFIGESDAVKNLGGILIHNLSNVEIECLPNDAISEIKVDVSVLKELHSSIKIRDLKVPETIKILGDNGTIIATVVEPKKEKEEEKEKTEEEAEKEAIEGIEDSKEKGKQEEESEREGDKGEAKKGDENVEQKK